MRNALLLGVLLGLMACGADDDRPPVRDGGGTDTSTPDATLDTGGDTDVPDVVVPPDVPVLDPFDPDSACGASAIETERVPGSLLVLFDRSGSMDSEVGGGSATKWDLAVQGMNRALAAVSGELEAGLMLFPGSSDCSVDSVTVPVAPLSTSRAQIESALASATPSGGTTPAFTALEQGYDYLDSLDTLGQRGLVLVSDGSETCRNEEEDAIIARVREERETKDRLTFAVGLDFANNTLSSIAFEGGTPRNDTCEAICTSQECFEDTDCASGTCNKIELPGIPPAFPIPGTCGCSNDSHCVGEQTCEMMTGPQCLILPDLCADPACEGPTDCCHYNVAAGGFQAEFEAALAEIAARLLDSCVFNIPASDFSPTSVNVGVTFDGEERTVLRRSSDSSTDSWDYTSSEAEAIIIQGGICDRLLDESATVEIVIGCDTLI